MPVPNSDLFRSKNQSRKLTSSDPEPPIGTVVRICDGTHWVRVPQGWGGTTVWLPKRGMASGDPESWTKIAGNYGPVTVVKGN